MTDSLSRIKVLTPKVHAPDNKYLTCLWSSVREYGIEVEKLKVDYLFSKGSFHKIQANQVVADVIHLHWIDQFCKFHPDKKYKSVRLLLVNMRNLISLKFQGYRLVWTVHNTLSHDCNFPLMEKIFRCFLSYLCDDIIVMSKYGRQEFAYMYGRTKRVHIIPHGNYIDVYPDEIDRAKARQKLDISPGQKVLLHLGQLRRYKGVNSLLTAFNQIGDPDTVLLVAGLCKEHDLRIEIEQSAASDPRILLRLEFIPDKDIQIYMKACDWVVLPYQKILNSGSTLLATSFGRPVIVPQLGALTEIMEDGKQGFVYGCDKDLVTALSCALATPSNLWQQMCSRAYELAQKYDWSQIGAQIYQVYQHDN